MRRMAQFGFRGLSVLALVSAFALGSGVASAQTASSNPNAHVGSAVHPLGNSNWTLTLNFTAGTFTYYLEPLTVTKGKVSGTVMPPNTSCPGVISGTLKKGKLKATITYPGTGCAADSVNIMGKLLLKKHTGSGTFTANYDCSGTCTWTGIRTS